MFMKLIQWSIYLSFWVWHDGDVDYNDDVAFSDKIDYVNDYIHGDDAMLFMMMIMVMTIIWYTLYSL